MDVLLRLLCFKACLFNPTLCSIICFVPYWNQSAAFLVEHIKTVHNCQKCGPQFLIKRVVVDLEARPAENHCCRKVVLLLWLITLAEKSSTKYFHCLSL